MGTLTCLGSYQLSMFMKKHGSDGIEPACNEGDLGSGKGNGNPLQYSCLENSIDGEAWWTTVHRVGEKKARLGLGNQAEQISLVLSTCFGEGVEGGN